ncbi:MAG: MerR family transcriptional regulator, partial [Firmicutes bacterium]|nr:MerR family transcriptional regulator [Bacillota bacterium]
RENGIRRFGETEIEELRIIEYLKTSGLEIKDIKRFMQWVTEGPATYAQRKELFERRREAVLADIARLQKTLAMLEFKCWYYDTAIADGSEDRLNAMLPDKLPPAIQKLYDNCHSKE